MASERDARRRACVDKTAAEVDALVARGVLAGGNAFSAVLLVKGELTQAERDGEPAFSGADGTALRASLERLGYAPEDWEWLLSVDASGEPLDAALLRDDTLHRGNAVRRGHVDGENRGDEQERRVGRTEFQRNLPRGNELVETWKRGTTS